MPSILRLPEDLCNQIAAGEVVERPASVVKELVENAIDAGSTRLHIEVGAGGLGMLRITDDGVGMDEADARLALERHATSKIRGVDDLLSLSTFGFRGEALPSIASVSRFVLRTRRHDAEEGIELHCEGGGVCRVGPCGMAPGTIVEVRDLFFNVPARRKFLKAVAAEAAAIGTVADALALSSPDVTVVLSRDGRQARQWLRASSRRQRVLDARPDDRLACIEATRGPLHVEAYLGPPEFARSGAAGLTLLINGRVVRDRALTRVMAQAYGSVLEQGRYPVGVVYLGIDPQLIDVNVHPQKAEVRFADARAVQDAVYAAVSEGLAGAFGIAPPSRAFGSKPRFQPSPTADLQVLPRLPQLPLAPTQERILVPPQAASDPWGLAPEPRPEPVPVQGALPLAPALSFRDPESPVPSSGGFTYASLRFLAQVRATFLLCESPDGLVILDQHAAAERVNFARLRTSYHACAVASQRLLLPVVLQVSPEDAAFLEEYSEVVHSFGMDMQAIGPTTASVTAVPQILSRASPERLARDLLDEARRTGGRGFSGSVDLVLATMACHGSLRAGEAASPEEVAGLLAALDRVDHAGHCPHGRPLVMQIKYTELERQVGRR